MGTKEEGNFMFVLYDLQWWNVTVFGVSLSLSSPLTFV